MDVYYASNKMKKILNNERLIKKHYTKFHTKVINRLSELRAANNLDEIPHDPPPRRHKLSGEYENCWGVDISKNYRIILKPYVNTDELDPKLISEIEILAIEDYH